MDRTPGFTFAKIKESTMQKKIMIGALLAAGLIAATSYRYFSEKNCSGACCAPAAAVPIGSETALCAHCGKNTCDKTCTTPAFAGVGALSMPSCNLSPEALQKRGAETLQTIFKQVKTVRELENGFEFDFVHSPELSRELEAFVRLERQCCATLTWSLNTDASGETIRLGISGSADQKQELRQGLASMGWMKNEF
jgi:hypothetical protein